jgi:hypothetical protein
VSAAREPVGGQDPALERALRGVEPAQARAGFRAELRQRFLDVSQLAPGPHAAVDAAGPARAVQDRAAQDRANQGRATQGRELGREAGHAAPRRRIALLVAPLAAAAALVLFLLLDRPRPRVWEVLDGTSAGVCLVDGRRFDTREREPLCEALASASEIDSLDATLRLAVRDEALVELAPRTRVSAARFSAAGAWTLRADEGSLRIATLPGFRGRGLTVHTPDLDVRLSGTALAVDVEPQGTCVCCLEGTLDCRPDGCEPGPVASGAMCFGYRDRRPAARGAAYEPHVAPLRELMAARAQLPAGAR